MHEKSIQQKLLDASLPKETTEKLSSIFSGETLPSICYDAIAKHVFSPDLHPDRMDFILQHTMNEPSINVDKSASNEPILQNIYAKKTITDIPAWLKDHRLSDLEFQRSAQDFIFNRADIYASNMLLLQYSVEAGQSKNERDYSNVDESIVIVLMEESPKAFKEFKTDRYIHRFTKAHADTGLEFPMLKQLVFVQLDKALEEFLSDSYNKDEDVELLKLYALIANINNEKVITEADNNQLLNDIRDDVFRFSRDKEVQLMILAEEMAAMDWYSGINQARREARAEAHAEAHAEALEALVKSLRPFISDSEALLSAIQANKGFENTTLDMVKKYW